MNAATLSIFRHLFASVAEEMGVTLGRAAYSANIKERLDYSCALFLGDGRLLSQAAHIPVHLGAMPASVRSAIARCAPFDPGDVILLNDPYLGGTHLPDLTLVSPVFAPSQVTQRQRKARGTSDPVDSGPDFFVASRAHHADVGGMSPGSMPLSTEIYQEGLIIPPLKLIKAGRMNDAVWRLILNNVRTPAEREGDLAAQLAAHNIGRRRIDSIVARYGLQECLENAVALIDYAKRMTLAAIARFPAGAYSFRDHLDGDSTSGPVPIQAKVSIGPGRFEVDFAGTAPAVSGNLNAVPAIVESAVVYCLRCLALANLNADLPMNQGVFEPLKLIIPPGSLLDPRRPHAVAAGNVETSQRIVDVVFGALSQALPDLVPAASQGTMNNLTIGSRSQTGGDGSRQSLFAYYETIGGGTGAGPSSDGGSGMHSHMSNTRNTPIEALEYSLPLRVVEYRLRRGSGGQGLHVGGDGLIRSLEFLSPVSVTLVSERRRVPPYGLQGGWPGQPGRQSVTGKDETIELPGKVSLDLDSGDRLTVETPGGGGWGKPGD